MEQVRIDFLVTGNMSSLQKQVATLNAELMQSAAAVNTLNRAANTVNFRAANQQFSDLLVNSNQWDATTVRMTDSTTRFGQSLSQATLNGRTLRSEMSSFIRGNTGEIRALANEQTRLQSSVLQPLGRTPQGDMMGRVFTQTGIADQAKILGRTAMEWRIFNTVAQQGADRMVNWGKNTQWAGRQLMVGFTVPLAIAGALAAKTFLDLDNELVRLQKVYGSGLTFGEDFVEQSQMIRESAIQMTKDMAATYGQAGTETAGLMADLAATGQEGEDLMRMTEQTTRLSILGEIDRQEAMKATVTLQTAFKMSTDEVAESVAFLNAVENQTSTSLQDLVEAIPRAGTVVEGLGGSVEDLALYMTAMREGGISAAEGANALKSGLSSIIAPPQAAVEFMKTLGINMKAIVENNAGDLTGTIMALQTELNNLDDLSRQQAITKLFGKYQFARMNALFNNLGANGSQTLKVMDLMKTSTEDLAKIADQELKSVTESASGTWRRTVETFKLGLADFGATALKIANTLLSGVNKVFKWMEDHPFLRSLITYGAIALGIIGPLIMGLGLLGNMFGMLFKGATRLAYGIASIFNKDLRGRWELLTAESVALERSLDIVTKSMWDQSRATAVLEQGVRELGAAYSATSGLITNSASRMDSSTMSQTLAARAAQSNSTGYSRSAIEFGHHIPAAPTDAEAARINSIFGQSSAALPMSTTLNDRYGSLPSWGAYANIGPEQRPYLGVLGGSAISSQANKDAGNMTQYFAPAAPDPVRGTLGGSVTGYDPRLQAAVSASAVNPTSFLNEKYKILVNELGVDTEAAGAWLNRWTARVQKITTDSLTLSQAQDQLTLALRDAAAVAGGSSALTRNQGVSPVGSTSSSERINGAFGLVAQKYYNSADGGSMMLVDQAMDKLAAGAALTAQELAAVDFNKMTQAEYRLAGEFDRSRALFSGMAQGMGDIGEGGIKLGNGFTQIAPELGDSALALNNLQAQLKDSGVDLAQTGVQFVAVQRGLNEYVVALDIASGEALAMARKTKAGAWVGTQGSQIAGAAKAGGENLNAATVKIIDGALMRFKEVMLSALSIEDKVAILRAEGLVTEQGKLNIEKTSLSLEQQESAEGLEQLMYTEQETALKKSAVAAASALPANMGGTQAPITSTKSFVVQNGQLVPAPPIMDPRAKTPWYKGSGVAGMSSKAMGVAGLGMMATMIPTGDNLAASAATNTLGGVATGAMMGSMAGPWGIAIGAAIGGGIMGGGAINKAINEENAKAIADAKVEWERFSIFLGDEMSESLGKAFNVDNYDPDAIFKDWASPVDITVDPSSYQENLEKFNSAVSDNFGEEIAAMAESTAEMASDEAVILYDNLIMSGFNPKKAAKIIQQVMREAGKEEIILDVTARISKIDTTAEASASASDVLYAQARASAEENLMGDFGVGWYWNEDSHNKESQTAAARVGALDGEAYARSVEKNAKPEDIEAGWLESVQTGIDEIEKANELEWGTSMTRNPWSMQVAGLTGQIEEDLNIVWGEWTKDQRDSFFETLTPEGRKLFGDMNAYLSASADIVGGGLSDAWALEYEKSDAAVTSANALLLTLQKMVDVANNMPNAAAGAVQTAEGAFMGMIPEPTVTSEDVSDLQKEQEEAMKQAERNAERQREAIQDQRDAIDDQREALQDQQDALDKQSDKINKHIDQINNQYDKEIAKIEEAEQKRQEAFAKEEERFRRRQEMRNLEISYQEAIANGDLFEAARIRMDMAATRKQQDAEDANQKKADQAQAKIDRLEKKREKEIKFQEKKLKEIEKQTKALERQNEALDEQEKALDDQEAAIDDHLEFIKDSQRQELKSLRETMKEQAQEHARAANKIQRIWANNNLTLQQKMRESSKVLGDITKQTAEQFLKVWESTYGKVGKNAAAKIKQSLMDGNWSGVTETLAKQLGMDQSDLNQLSGLVKYIGDSRYSVTETADGDWMVTYNDAQAPAPHSGPGGRGPGGYSTGGFVSGPGGGTTDSIDARLSNGEYVIRQGAVAKYGKSFFDKVNGGVGSPRPGGGGLGFASGGVVSTATEALSIRGATMAAAQTIPVKMIQTILKVAKTSSKKTASDTSVDSFNDPGSAASGKLVYWDGEPIDQLVAAQLRIAGRILGSRLSVLQGSYQPSTPYSGTTHTDGGVIDTNGSGVFGPEVIALQKAGFAAWYRDQAHGGYDPHIHAISLFSNNLDSNAAWQRQAYIDMSSDGLSGSSPYYGPHAAPLNNLKAKLPGLRKGGKINYDNTIANLHRGETVLTAPLTSAFEKNVAGGAGNTYNFNVDTIELHKELDLKNEFMKFTKAHERQQEQRTGRSRSI